MKIVLFYFFNLKYSNQKVHLQFPAKELQERAPVPSATPKPPGVDERVAPAVRYHVHCLDEEGFKEFVGSAKTLLGQANYEQVERMLDRFFVIEEKGEIKIEADVKPEDDSAVKPEGELKDDEVKNEPPDAAKKTYSDLLDLRTPLDWLAPQRP